MCLIIFAKDAHPRYKLVLAANRDEFYRRPTAPANFWRDAPEVLAGKDLAAGGTWLGITTSGRFAAVTNYRDSLAPAGEKSRGDLTKIFLIGDESPLNYLQKIERIKHDFSGFSLLVGNFGASETELYYFSNRGEKPKELSSGIYGLSNALLDTAWHKVETSRARLTELLHRRNEISSADLFAILADPTPAADEKLPTTGIGIERERVLSPAFIKTDGYGTRQATVLLVEHNGRASFAEKTFVGTIGEINQKFAL